jgi:CRP/FNR family cyclic AMP-dependent transcriptional regulator
MREIARPDENKVILQLFGNIRKITSLPDEDVHTLIKSGKFRIYEEGETLIKEGEYDCMVYFLISGQLIISKDGQAIGKLECNGDMFGEMGIIDGSPRSASIHAAKKTMVLGLDASYLDQKQKSSNLAFCNILYRLFAEVMATRLRETTLENIRLKEAVGKSGNNY